MRGLFSNAGGSIYSASKFALEGWVEGLAEELAPIGTRSLVIEPGMLRADFLDASSARHGDIEIADFAEAGARLRSFIAGANHTQSGDPTKLTACVVELAALPSPPPRHLFGDDAFERVSAKLNRLCGEVKHSAER